jgi:hypothetical protein
MMFGDTVVGATTVGATTVGETTVGVTTVGVTTVGATTVGATTVGVTTVGETMVGETTVGETHGALCASHSPSGSAGGAGPLTVPKAKTPATHSVALMPSPCTRTSSAFHPTMRSTGMKASNARSRNPGVNETGWPAWPSRLCFLAQGRASTV